MRHAALPPPALQLLHAGQQALHAAIADAVVAEVFDEVAKVVDVAAGEAAGAGDQAGLLLEAEPPGPLRMGRACSGP